MATPMGGGSIEVLTGLEAVRRRPGMYIGDTDDGSGLHHLLWEVVGNSVDEHLAGYASYVRVRLGHGWASVEDDGRGIPTEPLPDGASALEAVMTRLHAGTNKRPHVHIGAGMHQVGVAVVNALSSSLDAEVWRDGRAYRMRFARGEPLARVEDLGPTVRSGTRVTFEPDFTIFKERRWDRAVIRERMHELAATSSRLTTIFDGECFRCPDGLAELTGGEPVHLRSSRDGIDVEVALAWTDAPDTIVRGFVGMCRGDGTHVLGLKAGLRAAMRQLDPRFRRARTAEIDRVFLRGLVALVNVMLDDPRFMNPTRDWLFNPEVESVVKATVVDGLRARWPYDPALRDRLLERV
jgi:DNA gyrase subunit B